MASFNARELLTKLLTERLAQTRGMWGTKDEQVKLVITGPGGGSLMIDFSSEPPEVRRGDVEDAHCVITLANEDLGKILAGRLDPQLAFVEGRLTIAGYVDLALRIGRVLFGAQPGP
jgi:hypothetical protein